MILFKMHFSIFFYLKHKPKIAASFIATNIIASLIATKGPSNQSYGFPSSHVRMWKLDCKESWVLKKWCFWTAVLQKTLEGPLDCKEIQPVNPKGNRSWIFIGRTDAENEVPILWPPDAKNWLIGKDSDAGRDWGQEEKVTAEVEMVGCHHWLNGHQFDQASGDGEGQGPGVLQSVGSQRFRHNSVTEHKSCCEEMKKSYG